MYCLDLALGKICVSQEKINTTLIKITKKKKTILTVSIFEAWLRLALNRTQKVGKHPSLHGKFTEDSMGVTMHALEPEFN